MSENRELIRQIATDICQLRIEYLVKENPFASGAMVSTRDGFEVAKSLHKALSASKLAAMSSSLLSVADAITLLGGGTSCANVVIESETGRIVTMSVPSHRINLLVTAFCATNASLGQVLWQIRKCALDIARELDATLSELENLPRLENAGARAPAGQEP